jgi:hypothetical protein
MRSILGDEIAAAGEAVSRDSVPALRERGGVHGSTSDRTGAGGGGASRATGVV